MRHFTTIILLFCATLAYSQNNPKDSLITPVEAAQRTVLHKYLDSIKIYKKRIETLEKSKKAGSKTDGYANNRYMRLFTPLNFYGDLAHRRFSLDPDQGLTTDNQMLIDNALLNIYINHPSLVLGKVQRTEPPAGTEKSGEVVPVFNPGLAVYDAPKADEINVDKVDLVIKKPNFWTLKGEFYVQMMQNFYSANWYQGGESNYSALSRVTLWANYNNKQKIKFENKLELQLGLMTNPNDTVHSIKTSADLIRLTSELGIKAIKKWDYTLKVIANSQFMKTFASNSNTVNSSFMNPFNINASIGMDYVIDWCKGKLKGKIHLAPLACNWKYVSNVDLGPRNGIEEGKHGKFDLGSTCTIDFEWKFNDVIKWRTMLYAYTTYKRVEMQWENTFDLKIAKYLNASIYLYPRFDDSNINRKDSSFGYFQLKEFTSIGLTYAF